MEVIESILDIEIIEILKSAVAIITVTAVFFNFKDKFSNFQSKSQLNTDFGILEKAKKIPNINTELIQNHIESEIEKLYPDDPPKKLFNLFYGGTLFIGFGWWTIDIIQNSDSFNGWCILIIPPELGQ